MPSSRATYRGGNLASPWPLERRPDDRTLCTMRTALSLCLLAAAAAAQDPARNPKLHIVFVGNAGSERTADFRTFLAQQFGDVQVVDRRTCDPKDLQGADVVLLDWSQQEDG